MTAKLGGIDDVVSFTGRLFPHPPLVLDAAAEAGREKFVGELARADQALRRGGAVDEAGDPTLFGRNSIHFRRSVRPRVRWL